MSDIDLAELFTEDEDAPEAVEEATADDGLMSLKEAAAYADMTPTHMRNLCAKGSVAATKNDAGHWRVSHEAVDAYKESIVSETPDTAEMDENTEGAVSIAAAAAYLDMSPMYVRTLARDGKIEAGKSDSNVWELDAASVIAFKNEPRTRSRNGALKYVLTLTSEQVEQLEELGFVPERKNKQSAS